jgi:hypothetical protein
MLLLCTVANTTQHVPYIPSVIIVRVARTVRIARKVRVSAVAAIEIRVRAVAVI